MSSLAGIARFPRVRLGHAPTPLEAAPNLGAALGIDLWVIRGRDDGLRGRGVAQQDDVLGRFLDRLVERGPGVVLLLMGGQHVRGEGEVRLQGVEDGGVDGDDLVSRRDVGVALPESDAGVAVDDDGLALGMDANAALRLHPGGAPVVDARRRIEQVNPVLVDRADDVSGSHRVLLSSCGQRTCCASAAASSAAPSRRAARTDSSMRPSLLAPAPSRPTPQ